MVLTGQDLVAVAKTGSGKTVAFLLPIFQHIFAARANGSGGSKRKGPQCLVLAPTRELAVQIHNEAAKFGAAFQISACQVYGGVPKGPQIEQLKANPDLVIATPGRMKDLLESKATTLSTVTYLVLDEADRMLDMGFEPEIKFLIGECAPTTARQSLFFSATWPKSVRQMAANYLKPGCVRLTIGNQSDELAANTAVSQEFHKVRGVWQCACTCALRAPARAADTHAHSHPRPPTPTPADEPPFSWTTAKRTPRSTKF